VAPCAQSSSTPYSHLQFTLPLHTSRLQLRIVLDAALSRLAHEPKLDWINGAIADLTDVESSKLLALQLKANGAPAALAAASKHLSSELLADLFLAFLPKLKLGERIACFNSILGTMEVGRVLEVAETLLRISPEGEDIYMYTCIYLSLYTYIYIYIHSILGTMEVGRVLEVAETLLRISPKGEDK